MFEEQALEARYAREEETRIENLHRFADQKRSTYSRALRLADDVVLACENARRVEGSYQRHLDALDHAGQSAETVRQFVEQYAAEVKVHRDRAERSYASLAEVVGEIELLAGDAVGSAATCLRNSAYTNSENEVEQYHDARQNFLLAARIELGVEDT